jgi:hypothetical protein
MEGVTAVYLLTREDDFNALASTVLEDSVDGPVYRLAPPSGSHGVVAPYSGGAILFPNVTRSDVDARYAAGAALAVLDAGSPPTGHDVLFVLRPDASLAPVVGADVPAAGPGDVLLVLGRAGVR